MEIPRLLRNVEPDYAAGRRRKRFSVMDGVIRVPAVSPQQVV